MIFRVCVTFVSIVAAMLVVPAYGMQPAVIYWGDDDCNPAYIESVMNGVDRFQDEFDVYCREFRTANEKDLKKVIDRAVREGFDPVIVIGMIYAPLVKEAARKYPDARFAMIDGIVDLPNVQSSVFKEHEGAFLVGMLAGMKTKTGKVGMVGGMDSPAARRAAWGFIKGVKHVRPDAIFYKAFAGQTCEALKDPAKGRKLAIDQFNKGVDVIFHAAGATGMGVLQAAEERGKLAIGVDYNQNSIRPGHVLTSMIKRIDLAVYRTLRSAREGSWKPGVLVWGLSNMGVDWTLDDYNRELISPQMEEKIMKAKVSIINGKIEIEHYRGQ